MTLDSRELQLLAYRAFLRRPLQWRTLKEDGETMLLPFLGDSHNEHPALMDDESARIWARFANNKFELHVVFKILDKLREYEQQHYLLLQAMKLYLEKGMWYRTDAREGYTLSVMTDREAEAYRNPEPIANETEVQRLANDPDCDGYSQIYYTEVIACLKWIKDISKVVA